MLTFGKALYAFPYAVGVRPPGRIPPELRDVVGKPLQGMVYLYRPDPMGTADVIRYDGTGWHATPSTPHVLPLERLSIYGSPPI